MEALAAGALIVLAGATLQGVLWYLRRQRR